MPVKFIAIAALVALAAGYAVYENEELRHDISDFVKTQRRKLAESLRKFADGLHREEVEEPYAMRSRPGTGSSSSTIHGAATGREGANFDGGEFRRRGFRSGSMDGMMGAGVGAVAGAGAAEVVFDSESEKKAQSQEKAQEQEPESGYETMEKETEHLTEKNEPAGTRTPTSPVSSTRTLSATAGVAPTLPHDPLANSQPYWSIHEWAENTTGGSGMSDFELASSEPSLAGSDAEQEEMVEYHDDESEAPPMSETSSEEFEDVGTPGEGSLAGWSEVGSEVSGEDEGRGRF